MEIVKLEAQRREHTGKKASKLERRGDLVPCNLYGNDENISFSLDYNSLKKGIYTDKFKVFEINIDGSSKKAIVKEVQFHPVKDIMLHADFQELVPGKLIKTEIPIVTKGFAVGQQAGGKLEMKLRKIAVKADANNIPSEIVVDVTNLELGKSLRVRDIEADNFEILNAGPIPIVSVAIPRALRSAQDSADGEETADAEASEEGTADAAAEGGKE